MPHVKQDMKKKRAVMQNCPLREVMSAEKSRAADL